MSALKSRRAKHLPYRPRRSPSQGFVQCRNSPLTLSLRGLSDRSPKSEDAERSFPKSRYSRQSRFPFRSHHSFHRSLFPSLPKTVSHPMADPSLILKTVTPSARRFLPSEGTSVRHVRQGRFRQSPQHPISQRRYSLFLASPCLFREPPSPSPNCSENIGKTPKDTTKPTVSRFPPYVPVYETAYADTAVNARPRQAPNAESNGSD